MVQAEKFRAKAQRPEQSRSHTQYCRYLYYLGRIKAIQLEYTDARDYLQQAARKVSCQSVGQPCAAYVRSNPKFQRPVSLGSMRFRFTVEKSQIGSTFGAMNRDSDSSRDLLHFQSRWGCGRGASTAIQPLRGCRTNQCEEEGKQEMGLLCACVKTCLPLGTAW